MGDRHYTQSLAYALLQKFTEYREMVERFSAVAEFCPIPCFVTAHDGTSILYVNPAYTAMTGYGVDELQNASWSKVVHPEDRQEAIDVWLKFCRDAQPVNFQQRYVHAETGVVTKVITTVHVVKGNGFVGFMTPIELVPPGGWRPQQDSHLQPAT